MQAQAHEKISLVLEKIREHVSDFLYDAKVEAFNEFFLRQYLEYELQSRLETVPPQTNNLALLYFNIDSLMRINAKYSPEIGDETIRNIAYLIRQNKNAEDLFIKRNGPGFILLVTSTSDKGIPKYVSLIQSEIKKAEIFAEPMTVSVAVVYATEFASEQESVEWARKILSAGQKRVNVVPKMGPNAYLDKDIPDQSSMIGKVLIVEHDVLLLRILKAFFEKNAIEVVSCDNGATALDLSQKSPYDAILAERNAPKLDGFLLKSELNKSYMTMNTLYIMMVHRKTPEDILRANEERVDYIVEKPLIFPEILGFIEREFKKRGRNQ